MLYSWPLVYISVSVLKIFMISNIFRCYFYVIYNFYSADEEEGQQQERGEGEGQDSQGEGDKEAAGRSTLISGFIFTKS